MTGGAPFICLSLGGPLLIWDYEWDNGKDWGRTVKGFVCFFVKKFKTKRKVTEFRELNE